MNYDYDQEHHKFSAKNNQVTLSAVNKKFHYIPQSNYFVTFSLRLVIKSRSMMTTDAVRKSQRPREPSQLAKYYLILYNVAQVIG